MRYTSSNLEAPPSAPWTAALACRCALMFSASASLSPTRRLYGGGDIGDGGGSVAGDGAVVVRGEQPFATLDYADGTAVDMDGSTTSTEDDYGGDEDGYYTYEG